MGASGPVAPSADGASRRGGVLLEARGLSRSVEGAGELLHRVTLSVGPGELVAIVGGSGAGKTTLLDALAGVCPADEGVVTFDGIPLVEHVEVFRSVLGYVPQDDIIHAELPLERTLRYAARLRLGPHIAPEGVERAVSDALADLDLTSHAQTRVAALSGGQRKRASIAVEMLTQPRVFFLDEPTSGLDPATSAGLMRLLRRLADRGTTIVFTTHAISDLANTDRVVFLAPGGRVAFVGGRADALVHFGVESIEAIYERLAESPPEVVAEPLPDNSGEDAATHPTATDPPATDLPASGAPPPGAARQWWVLTSRTFETMVRNPLTLAILLGSPVMIVAMFVVLFQRGAFDVADPDPTTILMIVFWMTFGAFFFGLTYGLLQVCTERHILRREHLVGLRLGPYLLSKVAVLMPFLLVVNVLMVVVLRALDRLPAASVGTYASVIVTLTLTAAAALTLGIWTSTVVRDPSQATLALPLLCFPAVLFSGAILPVHVMGTVGAWFSTVVPVRWAFEAVGRDLGVRALLVSGGSPLGPPLVESYGEAGTRTTVTYWVFLAVFVLVFAVGARLSLARTVGRSAR